MKLHIKINPHGIRNLRQSSMELRPTMKKSLNRTMQEVFEESQQLVPTDTGALKESGKIEQYVPEAGSKPAVAITYGNDLVDYALIVHEDLQAHHNVGQAKFLEVPFERYKPRMLHELRYQIDELFRRFR